jgi:hypothetical protein
MGSKELLLRNKYKKQPFQKPRPVDVLSFNMPYMVINIYIYIYIYGIVGVRGREGEEDKRTYPRGTRKMVVGGSVGERWRRLDRWGVMIIVMPA